MKISETNKALVEIIRLLDPSFACKCNPHAHRFRCNSEHDRDCLFEKELLEENGVYVRDYHIDDDGHKIIHVTCTSVKCPNGNILDGCVK